MHECSLMDSDSDIYCRMQIQARDDSDSIFYLKSYNF